MKDIIREVYRGRDDIQEIRQELQKLRLNYFENPHESKDSGHISDHQIEILKQKVRQLPDKSISVMRRPSAREIASQNQYLLRTHQQFRIAAEYLAQAFSEIEAVEKVVLFGSVALPLKKEVPRFREYNYYQIKVWHECHDVDLAVCLNDLAVLKQLQITRGRALNQLHQEKNIGVAHHQVDVFIIEPITNRYLGRLCDFAICPKDKMDCLAPQCGQPPFLKQVPGFKLRSQALAPQKRQVLFERKPVTPPESKLAEVDILVEGYARRQDGDWYASPATVLIRDNGHNVIVDPGANKKQLLKALKERGIKAKDIDIVFVTHYHLDHIFNLRLFPNAMLCDGESLIDDEKMSDYTDTIPGTSIVVIPTPGHDSRHWSLVVETSRGKIAVAGDVLWWQEQQEQKIDRQQLIDKTDPFVKNMAELRASREKLLNCADFIIPGHGKMFRVISS